LKQLRTFAEENSQVPSRCVLRGNIWRVSNDLYVRMLIRNGRKGTLRHFGSFH